MAAEFANGGVVNPDIMFGMSEGTVISDSLGFKSLGSVDLRNDLNEKYNSMIEQKAQSVGGQSQLSGAAAGRTLVPVYLDPRVVDTSRRQTPLVEMFPRVKVNSNVYTWVQRTKDSAEFGPEDDSAGEQSSSDSRQSVSVKYLRYYGRVTGVVQTAQPGFVLENFVPNGAQGGFQSSQSANNAKTMEILTGTRAIKEAEENAIINGDDDDDANEFNGIIDQMSTTNTVDKDSSALTLADINTAINNAYDDGGTPSLAVCSTAVYSDLLNLLNDKIGFMQSSKQVYWGHTYITLHTLAGEITVVPSRFMTNTSNSKAMYFLDMSVVFMAVLQDLTYEELAKVNDSEKFMLKEYLALVIKNTEFCSSITNIA